MNLLFCVTVIKQKLLKYAKTWIYFNFPVLTRVSSVFLCVILLNMYFFVVLSPVKEMLQKRCYWVIRRCIYIGNAVV